MSTYINNVCSPIDSYTLTHVQTYTSRQIQNVYCELHTCWQMHRLVHLHAHICKHTKALCICYYTRACSLQLKTVTCTHQGICLDIPYFCLGTRIHTCAWTRLEEERLSSTQWQYQHTDSTAARSVVLAPGSLTFYIVMWLLSEPRLLYCQSLSLSLVPSPSTPALLICGSQTLWGREDLNNPFTGVA